MKDIQGTQKVWLTDIGRYSTRDLQEYINEGDTEYAMGLLNFCNSDMSRVDGWMEIGIATISVTFHPEEQVIEQLADGLRNQITMVRAEAQSKVARLEEKLSQLLALPNRSAIEEGEAA